MGGRGARYGGRSGRAPSGYRSVGKVGSVKIIRNNKTGKGLPRKAASGNAKYFGTDSAGNVNQLGIYGKNKDKKKDIDWTHPFEGHPSGTVHAHIWKNGERSTNHIPLTKSEIKKYKKPIEEATGRTDLKWEW